MDESEKRRAPNFSLQEKTLLLNIIHNFKHIIENKQTNSQTWRDKYEAWVKITEAFNSQSQGVYRPKNALKKFYDNIKKTIRKEVADDNKKISKTGGGTCEIKENPIKDLALGIMNRKTVFGLQNIYDCDNEVISIDEAQDHCATGNTTINMTEVDCEHIAENTQIESIPSLEDHSYAADSSSTLQNVPQVTQVTNAKKLPSECLKSWSKRRRPAIQQLPASKLSEEYLSLAKVKKECFEAEKENIRARKEREEALFELEKKRLLLDIKIKEYELKKYEV